VICDAPYGISITKNRRSASNWDANSIAFSSEMWSEMRRVVKPGGILAAFGHPRTSHRQAVAIEDAEWQLFDTLAWVKSHGFQAGNRDVETEIRRQGDLGLADSFAGYGTHLAPAYEPITLARNIGVRDSLIKNLRAGGAGALHIDAVRNSDDEWAWLAKRTTASISENLSRMPGRVSPHAAWAVGGRSHSSSPHRGGRFPGNVILEHSALCTEDQCDPTCVAAEIDAQGRRKYRQGKERASRFFTRLRYSPRAGASERPNIDGVSAPTVKPQQLLEWLCALVVKPGATVLDPFSGSGAIAEAALRGGAGHLIAIEREVAYAALIRDRLRDL